jgi:energy-coupling factor transport system permease protein
LFGLTIPSIWDIRLLLPVFVITLALYFAARIEWKDIKRTWYFIILLVVFIVGLNGILSGRGGPSAVVHDTTNPIFAIPIIIPFLKVKTAINITNLRLFFGMTQVIRMLTMAILAIPLPYTMDPNVYGIAFRKLGVSDKIAFTLDLAFRFLPTLTRDLGITIDAQRSRGFEMDNLKGGLFAKIRRLAPLVIPVTMQSTITGEEVIDAMELRAFGTAKRTWITSLNYSAVDFYFIGFGVLIMVTLFIIKFVFGIGEFWVPSSL